MPPFDLAWPIVTTPPFQKIRQGYWCHKYFLEILRTSSLHALLTGAKKDYLDFLVHQKNRNHIFDKFPPSFLSVDQIKSMEPLKEEGQTFSSLQSFFSQNHFGILCVSEKYYPKIIFGRYLQYDLFNSNSYINTYRTLVYMLYEH